MTTHDHAHCHVHGDAACVGIGGAERFDEHGAEHWATEGDPHHAVLAA